MTYWPGFCHFLSLLDLYMTANQERRDDMTNDNSKRGFAGMDPERVKKLASQGGKAAHASGRAHTFTSEEARLAGRKGGLASGKRGKKADEPTAETADVTE
jgi:general stress protein YciG